MWIDTVAGSLAQTQSSACFDICRAHVAHYSLTLAARHPEETNIGGLLTATMDILPAFKWQEIVAVRELATQVSAHECKHLKLSQMSLITI